MGKKFTEEELFELERFARNIKNDIDTFERDSKYIILTEEQQIIHDAAMQILHRKFNQLIEADSKKKLKKVIRLKKVLGDKYGEE